MNKPGKKFYTGVAVLVVICLLAAAASASGLVFSARAKARLEAEKALNDKYGITYDMLSYFISEFHENGDGTGTMSYEGLEDMAFVLGRYDVRVKDDTVLDVTWSHDGEDTSKGFESAAWGTEQLKEMVEINRETWSMEGFTPYIDKINAENGFVLEEQPMPEVDDETFMNAKRQARDQSRYSAEELDRMILEAAAMQYQLTPEQAGMMTYDEVEDPLMSYGMEDDGTPCYWRTLFLVQDPDPENPYDFHDNPTEKDGTYYVIINVRTGVIEDVEYDTGVGGNG